MDIRSSLDGLKSLLGVNPAATAATEQSRNGAATGSGSIGSSMSSDRATLSSAGSEVSLTASDSGVRMDRVTGIQAALASGSYNVSALAVASSVVNSMLAGEQ